MTSRKYEFLNVSEIPRTLGRFFGNHTSNSKFDAIVNAPSPGVLVSYNPSLVYSITTLNLFVILPQCSTLLINFYVMLNESDLMNVRKPLKK